MKKLLAIVIVMLMAGTAFADVNFDLIKTIQQNPQKLTVKRVESLLKRGADINYQDDTGISILMHALIQNVNTDVLMFMIDSGADVKAHDSFGVTVLMYACIGQTNTAPSVVRRILEEGANVNDQNGDGQSAIMFIAANIGNNKAHEIAKILIEYGAYIDEIDKEGQTVFSYVKEGDDEMREILSEAPKG